MAPQISYYSTWIHPLKIHVNITEKDRMTLHMDNKAAVCIIFMNITCTSVYLFAIILPAYMELDQKR